MSESDARLMFGWTLLIALSIAGPVPAPAEAAERGQALSEHVWTRARRMSIFDSSWHVRYPSLLRTPGGDLLLLFTRISESQQNEGTGELVAVRSSDNGGSWSDPVVLYAPANAQPRTMGKITALASGRLVGLVMEAGKTGARLRLIASDDEGRNWSVGETTIKSPAASSVTPHGRILEVDGQLAVGMVSTPGQNAARSQAGLIRSTDGGRTWADFSPIVSDSEGSAMEFKDPAVVQKESGRLVALVAGRSESHPLHKTWTILRTVSDDGGRSWAKPIAVTKGEAPCLIALANGNLACATAEHQGQYAYVRFQTSENDFRAWQNFQTCWAIRNFRSNAFVGRPAIVALDEDKILATFSRTRFTSVSGPGTTLNRLPLWTSCGTANDPDATRIDQERMAGVYFTRSQRRSLTSVKLPAAVPDWQWVEDRAVFPSHIKGTLRGIVPLQDGRFWVLEEVGKGEAYQLRTTDQNRKVWSDPFPLPQKTADEKWASGHSLRPGLGTITRSGRWIVTFPRTLIKRAGYTLTYERTDKDGYGVWKASGERWKTELYVLYSDDEGRTWQGMERPIDASPLNQAVYPFGIYEESDGTLVMNTFGSRNAEDVSAGLAGVVLYRSRDGGASWGDATVVAYGTPMDGNRFSENSFVIYPDGTWVLLARLHCRRRIHMVPVAIVRTISRDRGRTWTAPEPVLEGGAPALKMLPDGGLVCATSEGVLFSYDRGRSWTCKPTYANSKPFPLADGTLLLVGGHYHWHWTTGRILKRTMYE